MSTPFGTATEREARVSTTVVAAAAAVVLLLAIIVGVATMRHPPANTGAALPPDGYAGSLPVSNVTLSEATNGTGGKVTYVDGELRNTGARTLSGATVQVTFLSDDGSAPQRQTVPLTLVRTRVPYVDLESVSAEPLAPGKSHSFRLIFETVPPAWNTQPPHILVVHTDTR